MCARHMFIVHDFGIMNPLTLSFYLCIKRKSSSIKSPSTLASPMLSPKELAQVVKALDFGGISIMSKVRIFLGANNSLGPHPWRKPNLTDPCGGGMLYGSRDYPLAVSTRSGPAFGDSP